MAERSAEERIELWYQQQAHALKMTQLDWLIHVTSSGHATPQEYVEGARTFLEVMQARNTSLAQNPAEMVQDRLDASAERARDIRQRSAWHPSGCGLGTVWTGIPRAVQELVRPALERGRRRAGHA